MSRCLLPQRKRKNVSGNVALPSAVAFTGLHVHVGSGEKATECVPGAAGAGTVRALNF